MQENLIIYHITANSETDNLTTNVVHAEVHAHMEPREPEVPTEAQIPDEALDQVWHPPTPKDPS